MKLIRFVSGLLALAAAAWAADPKSQPLLPGLQPDGSTLLHSQWSIRPAGRQIELGDFPTGLAVHPDGRWAAVLHCGFGAHELWVVDLVSGAVTATAHLEEAFYGVAFSGDGRTLACSGASDEVLHVFDFAGGRLTARPDIVLAPKAATVVPAGLALSRDGKTVLVAGLWGQRALRVDLVARRVVWDVSLASTVPVVAAEAKAPPSPPDAPAAPPQLNENVLPYAVAWDARHHRVFVSLWGASEIDVLNDRDGAILARWPAGDRPDGLGPVGSMGERRRALAPTRGVARRGRIARASGMLDRFDLRWPGGTSTRSGAAEDRGCDGREPGAELRTRLGKPAVRIGTPETRSMWLR